MTSLSGVACTCTTGNACLCRGGKGVRPPFPPVFDSPGGSASSSRANYPKCMRFIIIPHFPRRRDTLAEDQTLRCPCARCSRRLRWGRIPGMGRFPSARSRIRVPGFRWWAARQPRWCRFWPGAGLSGWPPGLGNPYIAAWSYAAPPLSPSWKCVDDRGFSKGAHSTGIRLCTPPCLQSVLLLVSCHDGFPSRAAGWERATPGLWSGPRQGIARWV